MTLWRRAQREVYQVYGEDEYLSEDGLPGSDAEPSPPLPAAEQRHEQGYDSRSARLVGLGLLAGVTIGTLALVTLNMAHRSGAPSPGVAQDASGRGLAGKESGPAPVNDSVSVASATSEPLAPGAPGAASHARASVPMRMPMRPGVPPRRPRWPRVGMAGESISSATSTEPEETRLSSLESLGPGALPPAGDELGFER
jgi:hypothetical protein